MVVDVVGGIGHEVEVDIMKEDVEGYCSVEILVLTVLILILDLDIDR